MSKRQELREKRRKQEQRQRLIWIGLISAFVIIVAALLIIPGLNSQAAGNIVTPEARTHPQANGSSMGDPNAPVKVEEFSDFLCSHCAEFSLTQESQIITNYVETGKVYFTYIPYKVIAPESDTAAAAAYCASDQGKFWEYHDYLFANQMVTPNPVSMSNLLAYANSIDLDTDAFQACLDDGKYNDKLQEDQQYGVDKGIEGTPTFLVNGVKANRGDLKSVIDAQLAAVE